LSRRAQPPRHAADVDGLVAAAAGDPLRLARLARMLLAWKNAPKARELCAQALALSPGEAEIQTLAAEIFSDGIPPWHFVIVRDTARNAAYDAALRRAMKPGFRVLEIGTGTGLLAMMAARAGASEVVTCEMNPTIAERAVEIIAKNRFADRIRVVAKHSGDLKIGVDLAGPADVLVSEIVSNTLVDEGVLPAMEGVVPRLLRPGAVVIPAGGTVRVALAEDTKAPRKRMDVIDGFDLSPFNNLMRASYQIARGDQRLVLRSEPADLFSFDFKSGGPFPVARTSLVLHAQGGTANGIAQWIALRMDDQESYENRPAAGTSSCWAIMFHPFDERMFEAGDRITVHGSHDRTSLRIWADPPAVVKV
jgi:protein-L-isoaspartate O-methyltransferase